MMWSITMSCDLISSGPIKQTQSVTRLSTEILFPCVQALTRVFLRKISFRVLEKPYNICWQEIADFYYNTHTQTHTLSHSLFLSPIPFLAGTQTGQYVAAMMQAKDRIKGPSTNLLKEFLFKVHSVASHQVAQKNKGGKHEHDSWLEDSRRMAWLQMKKYIHTHHVPLFTNLLRLQINVINAHVFKKDEIM